MEVEYFHFLRPLCLLLLLPAAIMLYLIWQRQLTGSAWQKVIDSQLLGHLLDSRPQQRERWPIVILGIAMLVAVLALAGPTWKRLPQQVTQAQDALLIALDLSLSMRSSDVAPSRIQRAHLKLRDILDERNEGLTALIAYAGDAHTVAPFTDDARTIESMLPALEPEIMPKLGNRPDIALELGKQLLLDAGIQRARVLLLTDDIEADHLERMESALGSNMKLSILAVGTEKGGPIPLAEGGFMKDRRGEMIVTRLDSERVREAASELNARYAELGSNRNDIDYLLPDKTTVTDEYRETEMEFDVWHDQGALLALLLLPLCLLAFRRGLILPILVVCILPPPAEAFEPLQVWKDMWNTRDQQASEALEQGDAERASELFKDTDWKASAAYRAGQFDSAAELYEGNDYNRGNALAKAGKLDEAIAAYEQELASNPKNEDAAHNKKLLEEMKQQQEQQQQDQQQNDESQEQQDSEQQNQQDQNDQQQKGEGQNEESSPQNQQQQDGENQPPQDSQNSEQQPEEQNQDQSNEEGKEQPQPGTDAEKSEQEKQQEQEQQEARAQAQKDAQPNAERQQELEQWLRKVPDDPGGLLRNKFRYQYEQNRRKREHYDKDGEIY